MQTLALNVLVEDYARGALDVRDVLHEARRRCLATADEHVFIEVLSETALEEQLVEAAGWRAAGEELPLFGIPFAVKDNLDVAGVPTTAGCPSFAYTPERDAEAVARLRRAGAIVIGKTNLDQFATGLVGTRSPFGPVPSPFDSRYIGGGSSSGSAGALARDCVSFALGTDTAGSGRVPAAFTHTLGYKPTRGTISTRGAVPACRSLDCVSVFTRTAAEARELRRHLVAFDPQDVFARRALNGPECVRRIGVPSDEQLEFFGDSEAAALFHGLVKRLPALGFALAPVDFEPFRQAALLLYQGPWVAERYAAVGSFLERGNRDLDPSVRSIILGARELRAVDAFRAQYRLAELRRATEQQWEHMDALLLPTTGTTYSIAAVNAEPLRLNSELGYYTNFVNLLDLAAVAFPVGFRQNGLPFGASVLGSAHSDDALLAFAASCTS